VYSIKQKNIEFVTPFKEILKIEECLPQPASKFLPSWWKDMPYNNHPENKTAKVCPSFADMFSQGYVIPLWTDIYIKRTEDGEIGFRVPNKDFSLEFHGDSQFIDYLPKKEKKWCLLKTISPWYIFTPKGYSVYQMPMMFDFSEHFETIPGIIHTDFHHTINQQLLFKSPSDELVIERGTPFVWYIPFERKSYNYDVGLTNSKQLDDIKLNIHDTTTKFSKVYVEKIKKITKEGLR
jgi:hypothetical protein